MRRLLLRTKARIRDAAKPIGEAAVGALTIGLLRTTRYFDPIKTADLFGRIARTDRSLDARAKDRPCQPDGRLSGKITRGDRDHSRRRLGQSRPPGAEFAHLDHVWEHDRAHPENSRIEIEERTHELFAQLRLDGKPALIFASHLGNWELPALAAVAHGLDAAILFRRPNIASADRIIEEIRSVKMGTLIPAGRDAPLRLADALQKGQHVAMLVDQYFTNGVDVTFFGRKTKANPTLARLLRQIECPIHGVRIIRLPGHRFRAELSEEIPAGSRRLGPDRRSGNDAGDYLRGRRLDPRISGSMAVAASPLAVTARAWHMRIPDLTRGACAASDSKDGRNVLDRTSFETAQPRRSSWHEEASTVLFSPCVHRRLMTRWVAGSRAVMTKSFASIASSG